MASKLQTLLYGVGLAPEAAYNTASTTFLRMTRNNEAITTPKTSMESDANEQGKGDEFPTAAFQVARDSQQTIERYGDATFLTWAFAYALGAVSESGSGSSGVYTITPLDIVSTGIQLPSFSTVEQMEDSGSSSVDNLFTGNVIDTLSLTFQSGPGRNSVTASVKYQGSGVVTSPSAVTLPSLSTDHYMLSSGMSLTIQGVDYVAAKSIVQGTFTWSNALDATNGYFPGSGLDSSGFAERGRLEVGTRTCGFEFTVRLLSSSAEYTKLMALDTGTAVIGLQYDSTHEVTITLNKVQFTTLDLGSTAGTATVKVTCLPLNAGSGVVSVTAKCGVDGICIPS
jgi:hypothetical protein